MALGLSLALPGTAVAQAAAAQPQPARQVAPTEPHHYLRCAVVIMVVTDKIKDANVRLGLAASMSYFLGLWEGTTGLKFEDEMTPDFVGDTALNLGKYNEQCGSDMKDYGERLQSWGQVLQEAGKAAGK